MHLQVDALDVVDGKTVGARELQATIDAGMNDDTAGERLVGIERNLEAFTELVGDFVPVALGRIRLRQAARRFDRTAGRGIAMLRHQRRHQSGARGAADVKGLGHRSELLAHADGLRCGNAQRHRGLGRVESEQPRACCSRTEHPGRASDVPAAIVMLRVDHVADAALDVDAENQRVDELPARRAVVFRERQQRGGDWPGGMDDGPEMRIVEIEGVRRDAIQ